MTQLSDANDRLARTYLGVLDAFDDKYARADAAGRGTLVSEFAETIWPTVVKAHGWAAQMKTDVATACCAMFPNAAANVLWALLELDERVRWLELAREASHKLKVSDQEVMGADQLFSAELNTLGNLGIAYGDAGKHRPAMGCHFGALRLIRTISEPRRRIDRRAIVLSNLAVNLNGLGKYLSALACAGRALGELEGAGAPESVTHASAHTNRGLAYKHLFIRDRDRTTHDRARAEFEAARDIALRIGYVQSETDALGNLGDLCRLAGRPGDAEELHRRQLDRARDGAKKWSEGNALRSIGEDLKELGRVEEARRVLEDALKVFLDSGETKSASEVESLLANLTPILPNL